MLDLVAQSVEMLFRSIAAPGNLVRELFQTGPEPWATIGVSSLFLLVFTGVIGLEFSLRELTDREIVLMPDHVLPAPPDGGISTWGFLFFWAVIQGPLSAIL